MNLKLNSPHLFLHRSTYPAAYYVRARGINPIPLAYYLCYVQDTIGEVNMGHDRVARVHVPSTDLEVNHNSFFALAVGGKDELVMRINDSVPELHGARFVVAPFLNHRSGQCNDEASPRDLPPGTVGIAIQLRDSVEQWRRIVTPLKIDKPSKLWYHVCSQPCERTNSANLWPTLPFVVMADIILVTADAERPLRRVARADCDGKRCVSVGVPMNKVLMLFRFRYSLQWHNEWSTCRPTRKNISARDLD